MRTLGLATLMLMLAGCGATTSLHPREATAQIAEPRQPTGYCGEPIAAKLGVKLSMVRQQRARGQLYSALATLDGLPADTPTYRLLRADILRDMGRFGEARPLYERLEGSCLSGQAHHGLGRIAAQQQQTAMALRHLRMARERIPTDADVRNDLGFLLLATGRDREARDELTTALELDSRHETAARNLWFLLLKNRDAAAARSLERRFGWPDAERDLYLAAIPRFNPLTSGESHD
ncbi:hypothetical protein GCM10011348_44870 [Marinobacterium nitratireducens]|uniref:Uncharacterized protein n=1 Tax=Marinobacterium nitratireducens TaxID=518897 RepID=A0A918DYT3_9GAMM|nr:tetratricopeptide repeat protein [Marinobacterium nitratireducens]GGO88732.1 hypothetical protein GCM10011348_44870 [Marinobacterium nitratireducens]